MSSSKAPSIAAAQAQNDERQPLLGASRGQNPISNDEENAHVPLLLSDASPKEERTWKTMALYGVLTVVGGVLLGFFIKGFMDSDDVEVCAVERQPRTLDLK